MTPQEQREADILWLQDEIRREAFVGYVQRADRYRRFLAALSQKPVAWRIQGEEIYEEWSGPFDYITDDAGVAEESAADGHQVTPLVPLAPAPVTDAATTEDNP